MRALVDTDVVRSSHAKSPFVRHHRVVPRRQPVGQGRGLRCPDTRSKNEIWIHVRPRLSRGAPACDRTGGRLSGRSLSAIECRRLRTIGRTGGAGAWGHRREHKRSTEASTLRVYALSATLMMEGAEPGGEKGSHERDDAAPRSPRTRPGRRSLYTIPRAIFDPGETLRNLRKPPTYRFSI